MPESFRENENPSRHKEVEARWVKKGEEVHDGYKNHVKADKTPTLIEDDAVTDASVHDSQEVADLVEEDDGTPCMQTAPTAGRRSRRCARTLVWRVRFARRAIGLIL